MGGGVTAPLGTVRDVRPHKHPSQAVVVLAWGAKHGRAARGEVNEVVAVADDWRKLRARWRTLSEAPRLSQ